MLHSDRRNNFGSMDNSSIHNFYRVCCPWFLRIFQGKSATRSVLFHTQTYHIFLHQHTTETEWSLPEKTMYEKEETSWIWERRLPQVRARIQQRGKGTLQLPLSFHSSCQPSYPLRHPVQQRTGDFFYPEHTTVRKLKHCKISVIHWKSQRIQLYIIIVNLCQVLMIRSCRPHRKTAFGRSIGT